MSYHADVIENDADMFAEFGEDASYTPAGGGPQSIRVVEVHLSDRYGGENTLLVAQLGRRYSIRKAEIAAPAIGDTLVVGADTLRVDDIDPIGTDRYITMVIVV